MANFSLDL